MLKIILFFIGIHVLCLEAMTQNTNPRFHTVTTKRGTLPPEYAKPDSKRYKMKKSPGYKTEYKLLFHEYRDGVYKEYDRLLEHVLHQPISKDATFVVEMIPELHNSEHLLKLFVNMPGAFIMRRKDASDEKKCIKYVFFESFELIKDEASCPVMLAYEDDREAGEEELFISKYLKDGMLPNTPSMLETIRLRIKNYSLLFYTTKRMNDD